MKLSNINTCLLCHVFLVVLVEAKTPINKSTSVASSKFLKPSPEASSVPLVIIAKTKHEHTSTVKTLENTSSTIDASSEYTLVLDNKITAKCQPPCQNNGICRVAVQNKSSKTKPESVCFCRVGYTGTECATNNQPPLTTCSDFTCKNDGMCSGITEKPSCLCKPKTLGRTCERRLRMFKLNAVLTFMGLDVTWNSTFADPQSAPYKTVGASVCDRLGKASEFGNNPNLVATFVNCSVVDYEKSISPLRANVIIELDYSDSLASRITDSVVQKHFISGLYFQRGIPVDIGDPEYDSLKLQGMDLCATGNNDCSHNAKCTMEAPGLYTCSCNSFSFDASNDPLFPGRRCIYDGLIIFTFFVVGILMSSMICIGCGCRRTIWYRYGRRGDHENSALITMPSTYEI